MSNNINLSNGNNNQSNETIINTLNGFLSGYQKLSEDLLDKFIKTDEGNFLKNFYSEKTNIKALAKQISSGPAKALNLMSLAGTKNREEFMKEGFKIITSWLGGLAGALIGSVIMPGTGTVGFAGLGSFFGSEYGDEIYDYLFNWYERMSAVSYTPLISISNTTVNESDQEVVFDITLSKPLKEDLELSLHTSNGTAVASEDYTPNNTTITIKAGETSYKHTVAITDDMQKEGSEYFTLTAQSINITDPNDFGYYVISSAIINNKQGINSNINFYCKVS